MNLQWIPILEDLKAWSERGQINRKWKYMVKEFLLEDSISNCESSEERN